MLESGDAYATKRLGKNVTKVMDYQKGSYFGERALIRNEPRAASVIAKVQLFFFEFSRGKMQQMIDGLCVFDAG